MRQPTYFVSDLHKFSRRSQEERYEEPLREAMREAETIILGGDIFDFRWSTLSTMDATLDSAMDWINGLVEINRDCQMHYLLGNHDCHPSLVQRLSRLSEQEESFQWHPLHLQVGSRFFLHGDAADRLMNADDLAIRRQKWAEEEKTTPEYRHQLYDLAIAFRLHKVASNVAYPSDRVFRRIRHYIDQLDQTHWQDLRNVYFGHTHVAVDSEPYEHVDFHNCGAPIKGIPFRIIEVKPD